MLCIVDKSTDPYRNLAAEEYLLTAFKEPIFRLWRNDSSVIVGRNQNAAAEINREFVESHNVAVVRRLTGGGAVFHDLGNVNYTFIDKRIDGEDANAMFRRFTAPIVAALNKLGVAARLEGRNDLTIDGLKFSGNAMCIQGGRVLQHGTLLFSSKVEDISGALLPRPEKYSGRSVQSVRSRVTNISSHLASPMSVEEFIEFLRLNVAESCTPYSYSEKDEAAIERLADERYRTAEWNFGQSPAFGFHNCRKFPAGLVEVSMDITGGTMNNVTIQGDFFFKKPVSELCAMLEGRCYDKKEITGILKPVTLDDYLCGISSTELLELLF